ncbi:hypothetical protein TNCV_3350441 [Trichonephila clavipes]|nr:hypothetical protein TNCV_3350441 [Trichonephila clavipes]
MGLTPGSKCASRLWRFFLADEEGVKSPENCCGPAFKADQITSKRIRYGFITVQSITLIGAQEHNLAGHKLVKRFEETGKLEDRARAERPCLKEVRAPCIAVEMEAIASQAASGTRSTCEAAR